MCHLNLNLLHNVFFTASEHEMACQGHNKSNEGGQVFAKGQLLHYLKPCTFGNWFSCLLKRATNPTTTIVLLPVEQPYRNSYQQFLTQHVLTIADYHFPILGEMSYGRTENKRLLLPFYQKITSTST